MPRLQTTKDKGFSFLSIDRPDSRYIQVLEFISGPKYTKRKSIPKKFSSYQRAYISLYRGEEEFQIEQEELLSLKKACFLFKVPACRAILNGFLISKESPVSIANLISEDPGVISIYAHLFFDISVFFNDLLIVAYIRGLSSISEEETFEKKVVSWGHYLGAKYIAWKIGSKTTSDILPSQAIKKVLDDSVWRSSEHALEDISSAKAKESRAFSTSMEVFIDVWIQNKKNRKKLKVNEAIYTFVAVNKRGRPIRVPELKPETDLEKKRFDSALRRRQLSLVLAGKMKANEASELKAIFD